MTTATTAPATTATFRDTWKGDVRVTLKKVGKGWLWIAPPGSCVTCGYRPVPSTERAIRNASRDWRFSNIA